MYNTTETKYRASLRVICSVLPQVANTTRKDSSSPNKWHHHQPHNNPPHSFMRSHLMFLLQAQARCNQGKGCGPYKIVAERESVNPSEGNL